jgi:TPR repeat protein
MWRRSFDWIDRKTGQPVEADFENLESAWDYDQANQPWDGEPDEAGLAEALALYWSDPVRSFSLLRPLARDGSPIAMCMVGEGYYWGRGVSVDKAEATEWFRRSFETGYRRGLLNYGKALLWRGDRDGAAAVFQRGADDDWAPALYWLARIRMHSRPFRGVREARLLLERASALGSPAAKRALYAFMAAGFFGLRHMPRGFKRLTENIESATEQIRSTQAATPSERAQPGRVS